LGKGEKLIVSFDTGANMLEKSTIIIKNEKNRVSMIWSHGVCPVRRALKNTRKEKRKTGKSKSRSMIVWVFKTPYGRLFLIRF